ncbi:rep, partial [Symbiodinium sp. KB8]
FVGLLWKSFTYTMRVLGKDDYFELNTMNPVLQELYTNLLYWIAELDIDGYRITAASHITADFSAYLSTHLRFYAHALGKENFFVVGEVNQVLWFAAVIRVQRFWLRSKGGPDQRRYLRRYYSALPTQEPGFLSTYPLQVKHSQKPFVIAFPEEIYQLRDTCLGNGWNAMDLYQQVGAARAVKKARGVLEAQGNMRLSMAGVEPPGRGRGREETQTYQNDGCDDVAAAENDEDAVGDDFDGDDDCDDDDEDDDDDDDDDDDYDDDDEDEDEDQDQDQDQDQDDDADDAEEDDEDDDEDDDYGYYDYHDDDGGDGDGDGIDDVVVARIVCAVAGTDSEYSDHPHQTLVRVKVGVSHGVALRYGIPDIANGVEQGLNGLCYRDAAGRSALSRKMIDSGMERSVVDSILSSCDYQAIETIVGAGGGIAEVRFEAEPE